MSKEHKKKDNNTTTKATNATDNSDVLPKDNY